MDPLPRKTIRKVLLEPKNLDLIKEELDSTPTHTMNSLAKYLCLTLGFISPTEQLRTASCLVVLNLLAARRKIVLPTSDKPRKNTFTPMVRLHEPVALPDEIPATVREMKADQEFGEIELGDQRLSDRLIKIAYDKGAKQRRQLRDTRTGFALHLCGR